MKREEGITLVALMITIIILIILAAVTMLTVTNHNIIGKAGTGAEEYAKGQEYELGEMNNVAKILEDFENKMTGENGGEEMPGKVTFTLRSEGIKFDAVASEGCDGTFEVEAGTTWEEFFHANFAGDVCGWIYHKSTGQIFRYCCMNISDLADLANLVNDQGIEQYKENEIKNRNIFIN